MPHSWCGEENLVPAQAQLPCSVSAEHEPCWKIQPIGQFNKIDVKSQLITQPSSLPEVQDNCNLLFDMPAGISLQRRLSAGVDGPNANSFQKNHTWDLLVSLDVLKA